MTLSIHPDPAARGGGFGFIAVPQGAIPDGPVTLAVMEKYGNRWLAPSEDEGATPEIGNPNWQSERHEFGPYEVHPHEGCDWIRIGPEIVNKIEEYTPLRLHLGGITEDVAWPDDVPPRAGAAVLGGLQTAGAKAAPAAPTPLRAARDTPRPDPEPEAEPTPPEPAPEPAPVTPDPVPAPELPRGRNRYVLPVILSVLALAAIVAALWLLPQDDPAPETVTEAAPPPAAPASDPCSAEALSAAGGGFAAVADALRGCAGQVPPDVALALLEEAAAAGDATALLMFGTVYDGGWTDPEIEEQIGLTFGDDPAQAAEYYSRAAAAGSPDAPERLAAICEALAGAETTLAQGAHDDYCN